VSELKTQLKCQQVEAKDELKAELQVKSEEQVKLHHLVKFYEKEQKVDEAEIHKLQAAYTKEKASLSSSRLIYATAIRSIDQLTESNKELLLVNKKFKKKVQDDQAAKFSPDEKMLEMQLQHEKFVYEREKDKRESKEVANKASLQAKNGQMLLTHSLRKKSKGEDILCWEIAKKQKDVEVSKNSCTIAALLRSKQMNISTMGNSMAI
jgi:hypothetical protein